MLIAIGGAKLGFLESLTLTQLGALLACILFITTFMIVGIRFGIWSLRLLAEPSVRAAFVDRSVRPNAGGSPWHAPGLGFRVLANGTSTVPAQ